MIKTYSELVKLETFKERFLYLVLSGQIGKKTFGEDRYLNQKFYTGYEWQKFRKNIIARDDGCDLGIKGRDIFGPIYIHHLNELTPEDFLKSPERLMDPENVISTCYETHYSIHYNDRRLIENEELIIRQPFDTCPWRK